MKKNVSTFLYFIFPYACILIILISMWIISNMFVISKNKEKILSIMTSTTLNNISTIENDLSDIENTVYSMAQSPTFREFFNKTSFSYTEMLRFQQAVSSYNVGNPLIKDMYIYNRAADVLIDLQGSYKISREFYETKSYALDVDAEAWHEILLDGVWVEGYGTEAHYVYNNNPTEIITYTRTTPVTNTTRPLGNITVLIDKKQLFSLYNNLLPDISGELYVFNNNGKMLMSSGGRNANIIAEANIGTDKFALEEQRINGIDFLKFNFISDKNKWGYVVFLRQDDVLKETRFINFILNIINTVTFLLGCALSIYFTYGKNKSYIKLSKMLGAGKNVERMPLGVKNNEFAVWQPYIKDLINENQKIKADLSEISYTESDKIINMLFTGQFSDEKTAREWIRRSNIKLEGENFFVFTMFSSALYVSDIGDVNLKFFLDDLIKNLVSDTVYIYHADSKHMAVLLSFDDLEESFYYNLKNLFAKIYMETSYKYNIPILIGAGDPTNELCGIEKSFNQAKQVIRYNDLVDKREIVFFKDLPQNNTPYYYPIEVEDKLIVLVASGNCEKTKDLLDTIYDENFNKRVLTKDRISQLIKEIYSTFNKINAAFVSEEQLIYNTDTFSVAKFFEYAVTFTSTVCANVNAKRQEEKNTQIANLLNYVNENYMNSDLSLTTLLDHFELDDISTISKLFKKHTNENFSVYLIKLRIEKACELLDSNRYTVKEIAEMVGYLSDSSFRRAFKNQKGVPPTEYRKS